jgi:hypothetical protein
MRIGWLAGLTLIALVGGCASTPPTRVQSHWGSTAHRPSPGATFAWSLEPSAEGAVDDPALMAMVRERAEAELLASGYRRREGASSADLYVSCRLTTSLQPTDQGPIDKGALVIDVVSGADGRLIWRGWADGPVDPSLPPEARRQRIEEAVRDIVAQFRPS